MKTKIFGFGLALGLAVSAMGADYQVLQKIGTTAAEIIIPGDGASAMRVTGILATSDKAASVLQLSTAVDAEMVAMTWTTNLPPTNIVVSASALTRFASNDVVLVQWLNGSNQWATIWGTNTLTNVGPVLIITSTAGGATNLTLGATVFKFGSTNSLPVGAATVNWQGAGYYKAPMGYPLRAVLDGTSACRISALTIVKE